RPQRYHSPVPARPARLLGHWHGQRLHLRFRPRSRRRRGVVGLGARLGRFGILADLALPPPDPGPPAGPGQVSATKRRLAVARVEPGLVDSRAKAQALILAGVVYSGERRLDKPGLSIAGDQPLELRGQGHPWVSRGGLKLAHALDHFAIDPRGGIWLDV